MGVILIACIIGLIPAYIASTKGKSFVLWWLYGAALFIVALPHSLIMKANRQSLDQQQLAEGMKKCPFCAEFIRSDAAVCRYCSRSQQTGDAYSAPVALTSAQTEDTRKCPFCAELVRPDAIKCKHCGSILTPVEMDQVVPRTASENKALLQQALDRYNKMDSDGALESFKTIILTSPDSPEAAESKDNIRKIFVAKELLGKACDSHYKTKDLGMFKLLVEVFPESAQADYARQQIGRCNSH